MRFWNSVINSAEDSKTPIVVVPSSLTALRKTNWPPTGANNIVIYANQLTRSALPAMVQTAEDDLRYHRAQEVESRSCRSKIL